MPILGQLLRVADQNADRKIADAMEGLNAEHDPDDDPDDGAACPGK